MTKKIAFIRKGEVPIANLRVAQFLSARFPEMEMEIFDITAYLKSRSDLFALNALATLREYGRDILLGKKRAKDCFWRTTFLFKRIKAIMAERINPEEYAFSFQMQSLFDASTAGVPHFVYTDHTNLANLSYPIVNEGELYYYHAHNLERQIYRNATQIFTRSHNITRSIVEDYGCDPEKVECVYAGSNAMANVNAYEALDNNDYANKNILFVGIDWERKGGPELVEAFKQVRQAHPDAKLTIVGAEPELEEPGVEVIGRVPVSEVHEYFRRASIYCMPTKLEPFGIVFIEALSYKLPLVATDIGAIPDFLHDGVNGYRVEPGDIDHLASSLIKLLDSPELCRQFGEQGYDIAMSRYNWDKVADRMVSRIEQKTALLSQNHQS